MELKKVKIIKSSEISEICIFLQMLRARVKEEIKKKIEPSCNLDLLNHHIKELASCDNLIKVVIIK